MFPPNCGLDEKKFIDEMQKIGIKHKDLDNLKDNIQNDNTEELERLAEAIRKVSNPREEGREELSAFQDVIKERILTNDTYQQAINKKAFKDFKILKTIGEGAFGKVFLAQRADDKSGQSLYAIKVLSKEMILRGGDWDVVMNERKVLELGSKDNFLAGLHSSFQTSESLFFVLEFMPGGDLLHCLMEHGAMTSDSARFYAAEIFLAINYLHRQNVMHRDLKPDNIMIDRTGHIKLLDFGVSKVNFSLRDQTRTFVGTPNYMAPEVILAYFGQIAGYGMSADWWSYGVIVFEVDIPNTCSIVSSLSRC